MSMLSDVTGVSEEDPALDEVIVELMKGTGLYASLKAQIAKFIENTGKLDPSKFICPDRADEKVLLYIYEYLQWVGMKETCSMLLFESPVKVDVSSVKLSQINEPEYCPKLQTLIVTKEDSLAEDDESQNVVQSNSTGDVPQALFFSTSKQVPSTEQKKDKDKSLNGNDTNDHGTPKIPQVSVVPKALMKKSLPESEERLINFSFEELLQTGLPTERNGKGATSLESFQQPSSDSTPVNDGGNRNILDLTFTPENPVFVRSKGIGEQNNPTVVQTVTTAVDTALKSIDERFNQQQVDSPVPEDNLTLRVNLQDKNTSSNVENSDNESENTSDGEVKSSPEKGKENHQSHLMNLDKNLNSLDKKSSGGKDSYANDDFDDMSTSDMLSLEIEEDDTQDISVATDTLGMSACDHVVNLK